MFKDPGSELTVCTYSCDHSDPPKGVRVCRIEPNIDGDSSFHIRFVCISCVTKFISSYG